MPKPYPREFREDVIRVARNREPDVLLKDRRRRLRDLGVVPEQLAQGRGCRGRHQARHDRRGERGAEDGQAPDPAARAGERGPAPRRGVSVAGEPAPKMMYPLVRELADDGIPVTVTCRVLKIARQPYYRWLKDPVTDRRARRGLPGERHLRRPP